jgi:hypothetical protein
MGLMGDSTEELSTEDKKFLNLLQECKDVHVFKYEDVIVFGYKVDVLKRYFKEKSDSKFRIWLITNYNTIY